MTDFKAKLLAIKLVPFLLVDHNLAQDTRNSPSIKFLSLVLD